MVVVVVVVVFLCALPVVDDDIAVLVFATVRFVLPFVVVTAAARV